MKIYANVLQGRPLDWAVGHAIGMQAYLMTKTVLDMVLEDEFSPSTNWYQAGPLIDQYRIGLTPMPNGSWAAQGPGGYPCFHNPTALIAAMRSLVVSRLGEQVDVPVELLK